MRDARRIYKDPARPLPWWALVLGGMIFAPAMFGLLWALTIIGWWLEGGA